MKRRTLIGLLAAMVVALVGITACGSSSSSSSSAASGSSSSAASAPKQTQNVTVMLDWVPNPDHLGLYTTLAHGYFKNNGLNVKLQPPSNVTDVAKLVATGNVPIGISLRTRHDHRRRLETPDRRRRCTRACRAELDHRSGQDRNYQPGGVEGQVRRRVRSGIRRRVFEGDHTARGDTA